MLQSSRGRGMLRVEWDVWDTSGMWPGLDTAPWHCNPMGRREGAGTGKQLGRSSGAAEFWGKSLETPKGGGGVGCPQPHIPADLAVFHVGMGWKGGVSVLQVCSLWHLEPFLAFPWHSGPFHGTQSLPTQDIP